MIRVKCAMCNKPVDRIEWFDEDFGHGKRVIVAHCHGERDEMRFDPVRLSLDALRQMEEGEGIAFTTKRIEAAT